MRYQENQNSCLKDEYTPACSIIQKWTHYWYNIDDLSKDDPELKEK